MYQDNYLSSNVIIFIIVLAVIYIAAQWRIYEKAGKPGWAVLIPFYNFIVLLEIVGKPWWWLLLLFIPVVNFVIGIWVVNLLSKSFGQNEGFTLGLIFLGIIFYPMLGFGNYEYKGPAGNPYINNQTNLSY